MRRLALVVPVVLLPLAGCGDGAPTAQEVRVEQGRQAAADAGLPDDVGAVVGAVLGGVEGTYRVTYEVDGRPLVVTQRPPDRRVDATDDDGTVTSTITVDGRTTSCTQAPGAEPRCGDLGAADGPTVLDPDAVADFVDALVAAAAETTFTVEERTIAGVAARCLVTSGQDAATICVADTGALLLVDRPAGRLEATSHDADVDDAAFDLPT